MSSSPSSEVKDPSIKLFGTMISMPLQCSVSTTHSFEPIRHFSLSCSPDTYARDQDSSKIELITPEQDDGASPQITEDLRSPSSSGVCENHETKALSPSAERESSVRKSSKSGEQSETSTQQEKTPKKQDKILPCPRCNSMETKFCYFNNYNVNQPRHFCKNCQRYWTVGGTMRNVPVGAGRRKNKSSCASHYQHIVIPESLLTVANANGLHNTILKNGASVLTFGSSDSAICDSMASVLNLAKYIQNGVLNGVHVSKQNIAVSCSREYNGDDHSVGASVITLTSSEKKANVGSQKSVNKAYEDFPPQLQCIPSSPWQSPWNSLMPPPPALSPGYPVSFYPTPAYWGCALPASLNITCVSPQSSVKNPSPWSSSDSLTSRKHLRDGSIITQANSQKEKPDAESKDSENGVLIPKTLRIYDPTEAAKSSIWSTLGIKNEQASSLNGCVGLFKAIPSKGNNQNYHHMVEVLPVLQANPVALSRSVAFHEQQA